MLLVYRRGKLNLPEDLALAQSYTLSDLAESDIEPRISDSRAMFFLLVSFYGKFPKIAADQLFPKFFHESLWGFHIHLGGKPATPGMVLKSQEVK